MPVMIQIPTIILPNVPIITGAEQETVADLVLHQSLELYINESFGHLSDKIIFVAATEIVIVGVPGPLWASVELSPYPSIVSAAYWAAIGGGGGALPPIAPHIEAPTGVNLTTHTFMLPWNIHSPYARLVLQTPVAATPATAFWTVQAMIAGKGG